MNRLLCDMREIRLHVMEGKSPSGNLRVSGEFGRSDTPTQNGRVYSRPLWEREISRLNKDLKARKVLGAADHPESGRTSLANISHVITKLEMTEEGIVIGEAEILDTARGRDITAILKSNVPIGVSSRGFGSTKTVEGKEIVQEDYRLSTFDFVAEPADVFAYPSVVSESLDPKLVEAGLFTKAQVDALIEKELLRQEDQLREEFTSKLPVLLGKVKALAVEEAKKALLSDPEVGGAKEALEDIRAALLPFMLPEDMQALVQEKEVALEALQLRHKRQGETVAALQQEQEQLAVLAKSAGYKYFLEMQLSGEDEEDIEFVREGVGDVLQYESSEALGNRIQELKTLASDRRTAREEAERLREEDIQRAVQKEREKLRKFQAERDAELESMREQQERYEVQLQQLTEQLESSREVTRKNSVKTTIDTRLRNHPQEKILRTRMLEEDVDTEEEVDRVMREDKHSRRRNLQSEDVEQTRATVKRRLGSGREHVVSEEERPKVASSGGPSYNGLGVSLDELRRLSEAST